MWTFDSPRPGVSFDPRILEDTAGKLAVSAVTTAGAEGTTVTVRHYGWGALRDGHPARHDLAPAAFARMMCLWWGALMTSLREHAERGR